MRSCRVGPIAAIDPPFLRHRLEQVVVPPDRFGIAEKQMPALPQREMAKRDDPLLRVRLQIDQEIAARDEVQPRERRVAQQVLRREHDHVAQLLGDLEASRRAFRRSAGDARPRQAGHGGGRIDAIPRLAQIVFLGVGREHLQVEPLAGRFGLLRHQHGDRIGLLARRAGRNPDADRSAVLDARRPAARSPVPKASAMLRRRGRSR